MEPEPAPVSKELVYLAPCGAILSKALHLCQAGFGLGANCGAQTKRSLLECGGLK